MVSIPLRCKVCGIIITKKPKARTPKYCPPCRQSIQDKYKEQLKTKHKANFRAIDRDQASLTVHPKR